MTNQEALPLRLVGTGSQLPGNLHSTTSVYDEATHAIYILGGFRNEDPEPTDQVLRYSLETGAVDVVGRFRPSHSGVAVMHGGDIVHFGGYHQGALSVVYRISPQTGWPTPVATLPVPLYNSALAWDAGVGGSGPGVAYLFGGLGPFEEYSDRVLRYNASTDTVDQVSALQQGRHKAAAVWAAGGAYLFGGQRGSSFRDVFRMDPWAGNFSLMQLPTPLPPPGLEGPCALFERSNGQIYVVDWGNPATPVLRFNPIQDWDFELIPVEGWPGGVGLRHFSCAHVPALRRVYIIGGWDFQANVGRTEISYINLGTPSP